MGGSMPACVFGRTDAEIDFLVRGQRSAIAVVGFGSGTVIGAVLADRGWPVTGIDVRQGVVDQINLGKTALPDGCPASHDAANTMPKGGGDVNLLRPSMGVGGYCLKKDPWFVHHNMSQSVALDLAIPRMSRTVNGTMPAYLEEGIRRTSDWRGRIPGTSTDLPRFNL